MLLSVAKEHKTIKRITETPIEANHDREAARADILRRAEAQGVKPFESLEAFAGDRELTADFDVDAFLRQVAKTATDHLEALNNGYPSS